MIQLRHVPPQFSGDIPGHSEGAAQYLEGVEPEPVGLVLDTQRPQPQPGGHAVQPGQRRDGILGEGAVEALSLGHILQGHDS